MYNSIKRGLTAQGLSAEGHGLNIMLCLLTSVGLKYAGQVTC